jgi:hypothetical protein
MNDAQNGYRIQVLGQLDEGWSDLFDGVTIVFEDGVTTLVAPGLDQAMLRGILIRIWDLNLTLISITPLETG